MDLSDKNLTKLPNLPDKTNSFNCSDNKLSNLIGSPKEINGNFICPRNRLTSLIGSPNHVSGLFNCSDNKLTTLSGSPNTVGDFNCSSNQLTDLSGSPNYIDGYFNTITNHLTSLFGAPKRINNYFSFLQNIELLNVSDIWNSKIEGEIYFDLNPGMAILPLIKFNELRVKNNGLLISIHKRNQGESKQNILDFQYDLMENGFADYAKWKP